ncbi:phosphotransferase system HPr (HPr) family protein [Clostridium beijerinckii]|uniref:HTH-type transcriptional regulatory protein TyrR n=1 Tax=Clostridium beijerinckii TaxID=1520 RepID=A0AAX0AYF5_CLOBE|nr:sigma 54-interacting transcriptional regulator [Clostridium beijerinckii]NRT34652.1 phosphotransferase system HPr (HPr) family protein [Clostridium beijerinckii]NRT45919.1 phosphotransferase system HPr (HPr) family protein [Clostridium beijerinckii]NRT88009.1 phosphotransferase system HPr (HPr) family protein [Clostridium beijerinckii]NRZ20080.1 phosphotransferase system HPr (HPr) family protein [Clostridium beijerinckii]NYC73438.1 phosphotransferase system HPr (HPr) family protein [Clostri
MILSKEVVIRHSKGLHARVLAMVVHKVSELEKRYDLKFFIIYKDKKKILATSLMPLVLLKVKQNEKIIVEVHGEDPKEPLDELCDFLQSDFDLEDKSTINQVDNIINNNTITLEHVFSNIPNGIIATDEKDIISIFNEEAERLLGISSGDAIGKKVYEIIEFTNLHEINRTGKSELMVKEIINNKILLINKTPIIIDKKPKGALAVFNDISKLEKVKDELKTVKDLKERLQLILETVQDGICVINSDGYITYVNKAYLRILNEKEEDILNKNIRNVSPDGARIKVLKTGESIIGAISYKENGVVIVSNVNPIIIDGEITGVVSIVKNVTEVQNLSEKLTQVSAKADYLEEELMRTKKPDSAFSKYIGHSGKILDALATTLKAAKTDTTVLIRGESGTGKELIAEGIHFSSKNSKGPFIRVNCAAIPQNLLESELFGYEKGAFTGAIKRKLGKFELAQNGTILLDEIGEMDKSMQAKVLRVIQEKEFQRIGGEETIKINVRIIAATHRNLEEMVKSMEFREDLYYRLNVIPIFLPPLRERKQDIAPLLEHFIDKIGKRINKRITIVTNDAMESLLEYKWPGNIRELENLVERIMALNETEVIELSDLPSYMRKDINTVNNAIKSKNNNEIEMLIGADEILPLKEYEKIIIEKALKKYGSYNAAGKALGLTHKTVAAKARQYGIEKKVTWE